MHLLDRPRMRRLWNIQGCWDKWECFESLSFTDIKPKFCFAFPSTKMRSLSGRFCGFPIILFLCVWVLGIENGTNSDVLSEFGAHHLQLSHWSSGPHITTHKSSFMRGKNMYLLCELSKSLSAGK